MKQKDIIWYVVADGGNARVLARGEADFTPAAAICNADAHQKSHMLGADRPGRSFDSAGIGRHTIEPHADPHEAAKLAFAGQVADLINSAASAAVFCRLVIVAPPKIAAAIRHALTGAAAARLAAEYHVDLVKLPESELRERLRSLAPRA